MRLNVEDLASVPELGQRHSETIASGTAGTANAVGVVFGLHRQAKIEDMGDGGHVDSACRDVGRHQDLHMTLAQRHQPTVAKALVQRPVQGHGTEAFLLQVVGESIALDLRAGEDDGLIDRGVTQPVVQQPALVLRVVSPEQHFADVLVALLRAVNLQPLGLAHDPGCKLLDTRRQRGAEHHGLLAPGRQLVDFSQVVGKAQVEHAIGLVDHQELHLIELDLH